jgi:hypothetical protein
MTKSLFSKMILGGLIVATLASGTAFAQGFRFVRNDTVLGYDTDIWRVWVPAGSHRVVVDAGGHTDIDLEVFDDSTGQRLASDLDRTSYCIGDIYMLFSGWIEIEISNLGSRANAYHVYVR